MASTEKGKEDSPYKACMPMNVPGLAISRMVKSPSFSRNIFANPVLIKIICDSGMPCFVINSPCLKDSSVRHASTLCNCSSVSCLKGSDLILQRTQSMSVSPICRIFEPSVNPLDGNIIDLNQGITYQISIFSMLIYPGRIACSPDAKGYCSTHYCSMPVYRDGGPGSFLGDTHLSHFTISGSTPGPYKADFLHQFNQSADVYTPMLVQH